MNLHILQQHLRCKWLIIPAAGDADVIDVQILLPPRLIARDIADLLAQLDGREIKLAGGTVKLATKGLTIEQMQPDWRTKRAIRSTSFAAWPN